MLPPEGSTDQIAEGLYFRVRNGYGCCPLALAACTSTIKLYSYKPLETCGLLQRLFIAPPGS
jgi:hypothetical protein